jgi:membrane-associated phospholipid phosphatase
MSGSVERARRILAPLVAQAQHRGRVAVIAAAAAAAILSVGLLIRSSDFDIAVVRFFNGYHDGAIGAITNAVYAAFGPVPAIIGTAAITIIVLAATRSARVASTFAVTIATTWLSLAVVKLIVHRPRPDSSLLPFPFTPAQVDAGYPSGHTAFVTALVVTIVLAMAAGPARRRAAVFGGLLIAGVGVSLVIDGVHYPSDVLASILWGIAIAPLARMLWVSVVLARRI